MTVPSTVNRVQDGRVDLEILTVAVRPRIGGMTSWIDQIATGLAKRGWKVRLIAFTDRLDPVDRKTYEIAHIPTPSIGSLPFQTLDKTIRWHRAAKLYRVASAGVPCPRILLSDGTPGVLKVALETTRNRSIPWAILTGGNIFAETDAGFLSPMLHKRIRKSMNAADRILVDGADLVDALADCGIERSLFRIQSHGIDLAQFQMRGEGTTYFSDRSSGTRIRLVWHGRLGEHHGPLRFLEIAQRVEGAEARLCGTGDQREELERVLAGLGASHRWLGLLPSEELGPFLAEADIGVYPLEKMAGVPTVLLESMASGLPTLSYPTGSVTELIHDGENGFVCADAAEMVKTVGRLVDDPELRRRVGANARRTIESHWSQEAAIQTLESSLLEMVEP